SLVLRAGFLPKTFDDLNSFGNGTYRVEEKMDFSVRYQSDTSRPLSFAFGAGFNREDLGGNSFKYEGKIEWRPTDRFSLSGALAYHDREGWLLHQAGPNFTTFDADQWTPRFDVDYFISAKQQFRISFQWVGIRAKEREFFLVPSKPGDLIPTTKPPGPPDDFAISDMVVQARYRWEIAPLSDIFIVYTRTSDITTALGNSGFGDLVSDAWNRPIGNQLVMKIRYRFGS
ncbi:MAG: DUF5916 domain-containing protein, partial [Gammaproteobacteria bacterium]|nr:DUF5916 domain-containing protein [Gammaproteobacteria bacterium]